ncbi:hypothetical protein KUCAC02_001518, partial [Chaenocephalus aceratus]
YHMSLMRPLCVSPVHTQTSSQANSPQNPGENEPFFITANLLQRSLPRETEAAPITRAQINVLELRPYIPLLFLSHLPLSPSLPYQRTRGG